MDSICPGAFAKVGGMMNTNQMELSLKAKQVRATARQKQQRQQRAQWWFAQMRRVVDTAMEWKPQKIQGWMLKFWTCIFDLARPELQELREFLSGFN
jgi:hypothetical protein